ncbi:ribonuclease R [Rhodovibrio sodomensis]|uniref:Ribonuclease R n=1 Tax=Rhodovibrio sodomensis TaxID=1088 RepID=A0ABS1DA34_9PROT|nr:ribonuclease R [Rhodovibrio sodomensis]
MPSRAQLVHYIETSETPVDKRELVRAFGLKGAQRAWLKDMLRELEDEGRVERGEKRTWQAVGALPEVTVIEVKDRDADGELLGRPASWRRAAEPPRIFIQPERGGHPTLEPGMRVLARLKREPDGTYDARTIRVLGGPAKRVLGIIEPGGVLRPTDKRAKGEFVLRKGDLGDAQVGEFVLCRIKPSHKRAGGGPTEVLVEERLGHVDSPRAISLIAIHEHDIPTDFPDQAIDQANQAKAVSPAGRTDLRDTPLITIDGADAKDFDDAVFAQPDTAEDNPDGYRIIVAIADVAHYVRSGSALDKTAYQRGNSVYFPDRVVPMLPEGLSNGWCSLRPHEDRGCLAVEMRIDRDGHFKGKHRFMRAIMRSSARLTYEQVQAAKDGQWSDITGPLLEPVIEPLYGAFHALMRNRQQRGTLDLDLPEKQVVVNDKGEVTGIESRERLDAHRLIEEFMIAANVAAAQTLERKQAACMYRVHTPPDEDKVDALRETLKTYGINLAKDRSASQEAFGRVLEQVKGRAEAPMLNELILRCQSQAYYSPDNEGHFGLALDRYAHFTSPIRRYADLLVHRSLIDALGLGEDGLRPGEAEQFDEIGEHISVTERRAQKAEFDAIDRFTAAFLKEHVGAQFQGRVGGVTRFGLFVTLSETGADGLVPINTLPNDFYKHDASTHRLIGERWGRVYRLGDKVRVRLTEADPITGGIVLEMVEVIATASGEKPEDEPVTPGGPGKGPRRHAARTGKTARAADKKNKAASKKAKKTGGPPPSTQPAAKKTPSKAAKSQSAGSQGAASQGAGDKPKARSAKPKKTGKAPRKPNAKPKT